MVLHLATPPSLLSSLHNWNISRSYFSLFFFRILLFSDLFKFHKCLPQVFLSRKKKKRKKGTPKNIQHAPLLEMWWHWHNHLHRDEFKEKRKPASSARILLHPKHFNGRWNRGSCSVLELISHWRLCCRREKARTLLMREYRRGRTAQLSLGSSQFFFSKGELKGNETPGWGKEASKSRGLHPQSLLLLLLFACLCQRKGGAALHTCEIHLTSERWSCWASPWCQC